jgi:hypothetical protein
VHPPIDGDVINFDTAFRQQFFHVALGQAVAQIPAHCHRDGLARKPEARERGPGHRGRTPAS